MTINHHSRRAKYRSPGGAQPCGTQVRLFLKTDAPEAVVRYWIGDHAYLYKMSSVEGGFAHTIKLPDEPGIVWYYFIVGDLYYGNAPDNMGGVGAIYPHEPPSYQITVYDPAFAPPAWLGDGVMMQIMPDRFHRGGNYACRGRLHADWYEPPEMRLTITGDNEADDFFGGDLKGITQKLPYIKSLGVTVIYLNPIFQAHSNHKYDTADYARIDPAFGTEADFQELCAAARALGIRIVLDGVFSHTGADSIYFNKFGNFDSVGAYNDPNSAYADWYTFHEWPDDYDCWWGFQTLPNVSKQSKTFRDFIIHAPDAICARWIRAGASGWRLDVADELPMDFIRALRARVKAQDAEAAIIGEVWEDPSRKVTYGELRSYCLGDTLDSTMNYPLRAAILGFFTGKLSSEQCARAIESLLENMPWAFARSLMNLISSHDKPRALAVFSDVGNMEPERRYRYPIKLTDAQYARGRRRLIAAWRMVCALPGMPTVYYGDEAGLYGMSDPYCRAAYPWGREDAGLIEEFRDAIAMRKQHGALIDGDVTFETPDDDVLIIRRRLDGKTCALAINRSDYAYEYHKIKIGAERAEWFYE
ncbi:MAG: glycoside hydrolase family 13 protein [Christensenellales bacterium]|jgi:glycosidase